MNQTGKEHCILFMVNRRRKHARIHAHAQTINGMKLSCENMLTICLTNESFVIANEIQSKTMIRVAQRYVNMPDHIALKKQF